MDIVFMTANSIFHNIVMHPKRSSVLGPSSHQAESLTTRNKALSEFFEIKSCFENFRQTRKEWDCWGCRSGVANFGYFYQSDGVVQAITSDLQGEDFCGAGGCYQDPEGGVAGGAGGGW